MKKFATLTAIALSVALPSAVRATVLTMQGEVSASANASAPPAGGNTYGPLGNGSTIVTEYGDRVSGPTQTDVPTADFGAPPYWYNFTYGNNGEGYTPNVVVDKKVHFVSNNVLNTSTATRSWTAAGDRALIAYPATDSRAVGGKWFWTFTADPGYLVKLHSLDFVRFASAPLDSTVNVYAGNDPQMLGALLYTSGTLSVTNVAQTISPNKVEPSLTLEFVLPIGEPLFNWAADNIVISQQLVPEPASASLAGAGLIAALHGVRRRRARVHTV
jgi:hypothetical protein